MYNKVKYANERLTAFPITVAVSVIVFALALADTIALHRSVIGIVSKLPVLLFIAIFLFLGRKAQADNLENRKRHELIVARGSRYEGRIISVDTHESCDPSSGSSTTQSSLTAEYYCPDENIIKTVRSGILARTPIDVTGKKCVIYVYNGAEIIHEAEGITAKRISGKDMCFLIIVIIAFAVALRFLI